VILMSRSEIDRMNVLRDLAEERSARSLDGMAHPCSMSDEFGIPSTAPL
jgi:hypothetical protein